MCSSDGSGNQRETQAEVKDYLFYAPREGLCESRGVLTLMSLKMDR